MNLFALNTLLQCDVFHLGLDDVLSEQVRLSSLLHFITGDSVIPPMGLQHLIDVQFLPAHKTAVFLGAQACYSKGYLPVVHESKEEFFDACFKSLNCGGHSYGNS